MMFMGLGAGAVIAALLGYVTYRDRNRGRREDGGLVNRDPMTGLEPPRHPREGWTGQP